MKFRFPSRYTHFAMGAPDLHHMMKIGHALGMHDLYRVNVDIAKDYPNFPISQEILREEGPLAEQYKTDVERKTASMPARKTGTAKMKKKAFESMRGGWYN